MLLNIDLIFNSLIKFLKIFLKLQIKNKLKLLKVYEIIYLQNFTYKYELYFCQT